MKNVLFFFLIITLAACTKDRPVQTTLPPTPPVAETYYYPPLQGNTWKTKTPAALGWNEAKLKEAFDFAGTKNSFGLIVLQNGRVVKEQYWNNWTTDTRYNIASAGKSVIGFLTGIAQQDKLIDINQPSATYLGTGWTSLPADREQLIKVKHHLSMTTGLDDGVTDLNCTDPSCLKYKADAGTRWAYHNAAYFKLHDVLTLVSRQTLNAYSKAKLFDKIGLPNAFWFDRVLYCTTREAARFGSLILRKGKWENNALLSDSNYFAAMIQPSQTLNNSYGYLWWLNGKQNFLLPSLQFVFNGSLAPNAPADMYMALGKDDKKIYVVPSLNAVVVRLGDDAGGLMAGPSTFDTELWAKLKLAIHY